LPADWEAYKPKLRLVALEKLEADDWTEADIESGRILSAVIEAIEIDEPSLKTNFFPWQPGIYGPEQRPHHRMHEAVSSETGLTFLARGSLCLTVEACPGMLRSRIACSCIEFHHRPP
jgi:hypothetical protein